MAKSIKVNAVANASVKVLNIIFPLITGPYIARVLDKVQYGYFNKASSLVSWFMIIGLFGIYTYGIRYISGVKSDKEKIQKAFSILFFIAIITSIISFLIFSAFIFIGVNTDRRALYFVLAIQILAQFLSIEWMNEAFENYTFILYKTLFVRLVMLVCIFVLVKRADDIIIYSAIMTFITVLNYVLSFVYIKSKIKLVAFTLSEVKATLGPLFTVFIFSNLNILYTLLDRIFLSIMDNNVYITYYTFGMNISMMLTQVVSAIVIVAIPRLNYYYRSDRLDDYRWLFIKSSRTFISLCVPMCIGLAVVSKAVILLYASDKYILASTTLLFFSIRTLFWILDTVLSNMVLFIKGYERILTRIIFLGGVLNLILNTALYKTGMLEPHYYVITTMISELFVLSISITYIIKNNIEDIKPILFSMARYIIFSLPFIPIYFILNYFLDIIYVINLKFLVDIGIVIASCIVYYIVILVITKDDLYTLAKKMLYKIMNR